MSATKTLRSLSSLLGSPSKVSPGTPTPSKRLLFDDGRPKVPAVADLTELYELLSEDRRRQTSTLTSAIDHLTTRLDKFEISLDKTISRIDLAECTATDAQRQVAELHVTVQHLRSEVKTLERAHASAIERQDILERQENIIISGLPETDSPAVEPTLELVNKLVKDTLAVTDCNIVSAKRLGSRPSNPDRQPARHGRPRLIHVRFASRGEKARVLSAAGKLKNTKIYLNEDLTKAERDRRKSQLPKFKQLRALNHKVRLRRDVLVLNGRPLQESDIAHLLGGGTMPSTTVTLEPMHMDTPTGTA